MNIIPLAEVERKELTIARSMAEVKDVIKDYYGSSSEAPGFIIRASGIKWNGRADEDIAVIMQQYGDESLELSEYGGTVYSDESTDTGWHVDPTSVWQNVYYRYHNMEYGKAEVMLAHPSAVYDDKLASMSNEAWSARERQGANIINMLVGRKEFDVDIVQPAIWHGNLQAGDRTVFQASGKGRTWHNFVTLSNFRRWKMARIDIPARVLQPTG